MTASACNDWDRQEGTPFPLGASFVGDEAAWNFALYSKHAETVTLCAYHADDLTKPVLTYPFDSIRNKSGRIWHCRIPDQDLAEATYYAYRIDGPSPNEGFHLHQFDVEKLLLDPYAKSVFFPPDFDREAARHPGCNEGVAALGGLERSSCGFDWEDDQPVRHCGDLVIYELHVRGFTIDDPTVEPHRRGTFGGVIDRIPYLKELGVTAVELMPVFQFDTQDGNYWGYMPLSFFAPHNGYSQQPESCQQHVEFREMVKQLHRANIEIILDVVYNHTCEGNENGPTYSYKAIDASTYYMLQRTPDSVFSNYSGTGNTLHTANRTVRRLIMDSLRYWVKEMHVDGFRFDLASIFSRKGDGTINPSDPPIFGQIAADPDLAGIRLIAEPWDTDVSQLGQRFPGVQWMQWNGKYRDGIQRFVRGDRGMVPELMTRVYGSSDLFPDDRINAQRPYQSVNYVTSHDGFTMADLVAYNRHHNHANGQDNRDGHTDCSHNHGIEGTTDVPDAITQLRQQQVRNYFALLMLSNGTPMFRMGDEFLQTQGGNNNPFNQDNETSWLDWSLLRSNADIHNFVKSIIAFRKAMQIGRSVFWRDDIRWYGAESRAANLDEHSRCIAWCLHSDVAADIYVMVNSDSVAKRFGIYEGASGEWQSIIDTSGQSPLNYVATDKAPPIEDCELDVAAHSIRVLQREAK